MAGKYDYLLYGSESEGDEDNQSGNFRANEEPYVIGVAQLSGSDITDDESPDFETAATNSNSLPGQKKQRTQYTVKEKLKYIEQYVNKFDGNASEFERYHQGKIKRRMIVCWHKNQEQLERLAAQGKKERRRKRAVRSDHGQLKGKFSELESELVNWIMQQKESNGSISDEQICNQARAIHAARGEQVPFSASQGWLHRFKIRNNIVRAPAHRKKKK